MLKIYKTLLSAMLLAFASGAVLAAPGTVAASAEEVTPIGVGADAPQFIVRTAEGEDYGFDPDNLDGKKLLIFYRGGWCPYCNRHLQELRDVVPKLRGANIDVLFLSADKPEILFSSLEEPDINYTLLSDASMQAARAFGIAFQLDDETVERYKTYGIDLEEASGYDHHQLPVPAVYLISEDGVVEFVYAQPDYKERLESAAILQAAGL